MTKSACKALSMTFKEHINLSETRLETLCWLVLLAARLGTVNLARIAPHVPGAAKTASAYRRLVRFFQHARLPDDALARLIVQISGLGGSAPWRLVIDRTNWKLGRCEMNILVLGVVRGEMCIPLFWRVLGKAGNSNAGERIDLFARLRAAFPGQAIADVTGDREFVGRNWITWLEARSIPFTLRLRENIHIRRPGYAPMTAARIATGQPGKKLIKIKGRCRLGLTAGKHDPAGRLVIKRLEGDELLVLFTSGQPGGAPARYRERWKIETCFSAMKSRGFDLEATRLTAPGKLAMLTGVLALAAALALKAGNWAARLEPPKTKAHGYAARARFSLGLETLRKIFAAAMPAQVKDFFQHLCRCKNPRKTLPVNAL